MPVSQMEKQVLRAEGTADGHGARRRDSWDWNPSPSPGPAHRAASHPSALEKPQHWDPPLLRGARDKADTELQEGLERDFPGGPVAKTLSSQCRGPRFDPWSGK